ncbi:hypothetical protein SISNIDRAFT_485136 [Sistotremastrum niveocremeum HHB9708]|uniref:Uncharacterized protein n=1 Tax=Sistotremastrum niveocremeum HHB9708 TaxID=1314777 RepID=A0A164VJQ3_9AGAM|nr:hypothetical protein SISNIDRAFT_485136 [Sistotremastrum niveocremeum HHB9708]
MVRFKNRWLLVEFMTFPTDTKETEAPLGGKQIYTALKQSVIANFGDVGWGAVGSSLTVKYFSPATNICIIRVARDHYRTAWGAITLLRNIDGHLVIPHVVHCSGTIKHTQLAAIQHNREIIALLRAHNQRGVNGASTKFSWTGISDSYETLLQKITEEIQSLQD